tara:strand:+ start:24 stop:614 length:591 start_codon:yes stop_codon:yes gene_type:complete
MTTYKEQGFNLSGKKLDGLSEKQITEHIKLYGGYVKNMNILSEKLESLHSDDGDNTQTISELTRRISFEWNGMRMHEYYFEALGNASALCGGKLKTTIEKQFGSFEEWLLQFKQIGKMRGIGWVVMAYDKKRDTLTNIWINDHELGYLAGTNILIAMDVWEHAYLIDYLPKDRGNYIDAFFKNLDWTKVEKRFEEV